MMGSQARFSSYTETVKRLDVYYGIVKRQLLQFQSPITGLFPPVSNDTKEGSVRDSIYCAAAIWSLYQAYRRIDDDRGKSYELGQSAVKCMRGVLECWIKQAYKIELFKKNQCNAHALHSKFDLNTGNEIYPDTYPHLQIDVVSLYLLYLVEMISSGLQIIYTQDEVAFIQNLVYYVERAYRTPDFGMWERGTKYNNGSPEIHASSIGMAKSALEAINGCNLFGEQGASWSVVYVDIDAHNRNRSIFDTMLPRESSSKEVDAALLPTICYPAFATHENSLTSTTIENIISKLKGKYGFKRFPRDGYKTQIEDEKRLLHSEGETKQFENVECEWPIFFIFMIIDGVFKNSLEQVEEYQNLLNASIKTDHFGDPVIPMYFYVSFNDIEIERMNPGLVQKYPSQAGSPGGGLFLWAQAMFITSQLLTEGLLHPHQLDPIRRHQPSHNRPRKGGRYSAFQGTATDLVVQIVLIAESMRLQAMMATYGIQTQTPHQVEPVQIWSSSQLVKMYEYLGVNPKLNLKGRPSRPVGALGTSKVYRICGMTVLCYPLVFEVSEFYLYRDMALLIDDIKTELQFVGHNWRLSGRPTVCLLIREEHMRDPHFNEMLDLMAMLKKGYCNETKVRIGRLQNLISSSCVEHLDFMNVWDPAEINVTQFKQLEHDYIGYQSLTDVPRAETYPDPSSDSVESYQKASLEDIIEAFRNTAELRSCCRLLDVIQRRKGGEYKINGTSVEDHIKNLYFLAGTRQCWDVVRYCSSLLRHTVDSISPFITTVLVNGKQIFTMCGTLPSKMSEFSMGSHNLELEKMTVELCRAPSWITHSLGGVRMVDQGVVPYLFRSLPWNLDCSPFSLQPELTVGVIGHEETVFDKPMTPAEIHSVMYSRVQPHNIIHAVLQQEVVLYCGRLIATEPDFFRGILKIRVGWVLEAIKLYLSIKEENSKPLESHSPYRVRQLVHKILSVKEWAEEENLSVFQRRQLEGCLCRVPTGLYDQVWDVLSRTPNGIQVGGRVLPQEPILSNMTRSELSFALLVEEMLHQISQPEYRQIIVELLNIVSTILARNPEIDFQSQLDLDKLVSEACHMFSKDNQESSDKTLKNFFSSSYSITTSYLARAVVNNVLQGCKYLANIESSDEKDCKVS